MERARPRTKANFRLIAKQSLLSVARRQSVKVKYWKTESLIIIKTVIQKTMRALLYKLDRGRKYHLGARGRGGLIGWCCHLTAAASTSHNTRPGTLTLKFSINIFISFKQLTIRWAVGLTRKHPMNIPSPLTGCKRVQYQSLELSMPCSCQLMGKVRNGPQSPGRRVIQTSAINILFTWAMAALDNRRC